MPNAIKYNTATQSLALKDGNFWIGTGDVPKGTTVNTDYWNGITPPTGSYTIYLSRVSGGPTIYVVDSTLLIFLTNIFSGNNYTTVDQCLSWYTTQTDKMVLNIDYPAIKTNGLTLMLDAGFVPSYPTTGTTWFDLSGSTFSNPTLVNGPSFSSSLGNGSIKFDGIDDFCSTSLSKTFSSMTMQVWFYGDSNNQVQFQPLVSNRVGGNVTSLILNSNYGNLTIGYNWNDSASTYGWGSGLIPDYYGWHFISISVSPTNVVAFLNGSTSSNTINHSPTTITQLFIGKDTISSRFLKGSISAVYIYDRALSPPEVLQNYNATLGRYSSAPKIYSYQVWADCSTNYRVYLASGGFTVGNTVYLNGTLTSLATNRTITQSNPNSYYDNDYLLAIVTNASGVITAFSGIYGCIPTSYC
jgi:hypothetical protein